MLCRHQLKIDLNMFSAIVFGNDDLSHAVEENCSNFSKKHFIKCIEEKDKYVNDIFANSNLTFKVKTTYFGYQLSKLLELNDGMISDKLGSTIKIPLRSNKSYYIKITDPKLVIEISNPEIAVRSLVQLNKRKGIILLYLKVIRHEKINKPSNPCNPSKEYNFAHCVERSLMTNGGCQHHWRMTSVPGLPLCNNLTLLMKYRKYYDKVWEMNRHDFLEETKCLLPCSFMEYKVTTHLFFYIF